MAINFKFLARKIITTTTRMLRKVQNSLYNVKTNGKEDMRDVNLLHVEWKKNV